MSLLASNASLITSEVRVQLSAFKTMAGVRRCLLPEAEQTAWGLSCALSFRSLKV